MDGRVFINETMVQPTHVTGYTVFLVLLRRAVQSLQIMTEKYITGYARSILVHYDQIFTL